MPQPPAPCAARAEDSRGGSSGPAALSRAFVCLQCARCAGGAGPPPPTATANVLTSHTPVKPVKPEWSRSGRHSGDSESTRQVDDFAAAGPFPAFGPGAAPRRLSIHVPQTPCKRLQLVCVASRGACRLSVSPVKTLPSGPAQPPLLGIENGGAAASTLRASSRGALEMRNSRSCRKSDF